MILKDILKEKGTRVVHIKPGTSIRDAVKTMVENKIGAILIVDNDLHPEGIYTERDNLRLTANDGIDTSKVKVDDYMTVDVVCGLPSDSVEEAMALMTERRVRHLPVVADGLLIGLVSIGDVVKAVASKYDHQVEYLKNYYMG